MKLPQRIIDTPNGGKPTHVGLIGCVATFTLIACAKDDPGAGPSEPASIVVQGPVFATPADPLADSPLKEEMRRIMQTEVWQKSSHNLRNA